MIPTISKKQAWERLAEIRRDKATTPELVEQRGAPRTPQEELDLLASLITNDDILQDVLFATAPEKRYEAYNQLRDKLPFHPKPFDILSKPFRS